MPFRSFARVVRDDVPVTRESSAYASITRNGFIQTNRSYRILSSSVWISCSKNSKHKLRRRPSYPLCRDLITLIDIRETAKHANEVFSSLASPMLADNSLTVAGYEIYYIPIISYSSCARVLQVVITVQGFFLLLTWMYPLHHISRGIDTLE